MLKVMAWRRWLEAVGVARTAPVYADVVPVLTARMRNQ
jgi:hypothetical protein